MAPMNTHTLPIEVHIFDTDCYGVMWHGAYTKWLEMGRVHFFKSLGLDLKTLTADYGIIVPVAEQNLKYKAPARHGDQLALTTSIESAPPRLIFTQEAKNTETGVTTLLAQTTVVFTNAQGKVFRQFPEHVQDKLNALSALV